MGLVAEIVEYRGKIVDEEKLEINDDVNGRKRAKIRRNFMIIFSLLTYYWLVIV